MNLIALLFMTPFIALMITALMTWKKPTDNEDMVIYWVLNSILGLFIIGLGVLIGAIK